MNVSFLQNNLVNSVIVNRSDGQPLYDVQIPRRLCGSKIAIRRVKPGVSPGGGEIIAEVHWRTLSASTITFFGSTMRVKDWLKKVGMFSSWVVTSMKFTLNSYNSLSRSRYLPQVTVTHTSGAAALGNSP